MAITGNLNSLLQTEPELCEYPESDSCTTVGYQYTDISIPIELKPSADIGEIETECCGKPMICCKEDHTCNSCEITITQKVCIKIPVSYSVSACAGNTDISCRDSDYPE